MPPDIDMIGEQDLDAMELQIGPGHVYTGGARGTDKLVEQMAKQFGMQVEVLVPPNHPRAHFITPSTVEVLMLANLHLHQAAQKLGKRMPSHFYTLQLLQRNYQIAKRNLQSAYHLCVWHLGKGWQTRERGHRLDRAIGHGSRQTRLPL